MKKIIIRLGLNIVTFLKTQVRENPNPRPLSKAQMSILTFLVREFFLGNSNKVHD